MISRLGPRRTVHHVGTYLLLIATIMHLIPVLTIPVTSMDLLKAENRNVSLGGGYPVVRMGTFGYCVSVEDGPEGDTPEVCHTEWAYDIDHLTWNSGVEFSLRAGSNSTNNTDTTESGKDKRAEDGSNNDNDDGREYVNGIALPSYMSAMTGLMTGLNALSFALCAVAFLVSLVISMCFITSSYVVTWVVSAIAAVGTTAAAAADYRWAGYVRQAVVAQSYSSSSSSAAADGGEGEDPAGSVRYGIGAATLTVALIIQAVVFVSGFVVCCLERRNNRDNDDGSSSSFGKPRRSSARSLRKKNRSLERMKQIDDDRLYDDESLDGEDTTYRPPRAANGYSNV
ncbi:hypothetical protein F5X96DRAFT_638859 [Biscogniauxia mediterranea]|nr:hypothetical protein F5X96DRAFT_638859 [Biscogniauxia mediterranea]